MIVFVDDILMIQALCLLCHGGCHCLCDLPGTFFFFTQHNLEKKALPAMHSMGKSLQRSLFSVSVQGIDSQVVSISLTIEGHTVELKQFVRLITQF